MSPAKVSSPPSTSPLGVNEAGEIPERDKTDDPNRGEQFGGKAAHWWQDWDVRRQPLFLAFRYTALFLQQWRQRRILAVSQLRIRGFSAVPLRKESLNECTEERKAGIYACREICRLRDMGGRKGNTPPISRGMKGKSRKFKGE